MPLGAPSAAKAVAHFEATGEDGRHDERLVSGDLKWEKSLIETRIDAPSSVVPGQTARFRVYVKNGADFDVEDAALAMTWPDDFRLTTATPPAYRGIVRLGRLEAGQAAYAEFAGRFGGSAETRTLGAELTGAVAGRSASLAAAKADVWLADAGLGISAAFRADAPAYAAPGEEMPVTVRVRNEGLLPLKDVTLSVQDDPRAIGAVRWKPSASVGDLAPGASAERVAYVRALEQVSRYVTDPWLRVTPVARFRVESDGIAEAEIPGAPVERKISGDAALRVAARYYTNEGDQIGRGPLPPKVGSATRYWIFATLGTGATELRDGALAFSLPQGVAWTGRAAVTSGHDAEIAGDRLVWRVGTIAPHAGVLHEAPSISFEVALTPTDAQVGTTPLLIASAAFTGTDAWTEAALSEAQAGLTTQLHGDSGVEGRTVVRQ
jgi:hypothetical protein